MEPKILGYFVDCCGSIVTVYTDCSTNEHYSVEIHEDTVYALGDIDYTDSGDNPAREVTGEFTLWSSLEELKSVIEG